MTSQNVRTGWGFRGFKNPVKLAYVLNSWPLSELMT